MCNGLNHNKSIKESTIERKLLTVFEPANKRLVLLAIFRGPFAISMTQSCAFFGINIIRFIVFPIGKVNHRIIKPMVVILRINLQTNPRVSVGYSLDKIVVTLAMNTQQVGIR